jgi:hypothetical protein
MLYRIVVYGLDREHGELGAEVLKSQIIMVVRLTYFRDWSVPCHHSMARP